MQVDVLIEDARWDEVGLERLARCAAEATLAHLGLPPEGFAISLLGCDDARIMGLNADFRGVNRPTNVLSWPSEERGAEQAGKEPARPMPGTADEMQELGDIAIAWETCLTEALAQGKAPESHVTHLLVHGIMHLLGYDHVSDEDAALMEGHERRILATLGVSDPY